MVNPDQVVMEAHALVRKELSEEIYANPYAQFMTMTLRDRCEELQAQANGHWASLQAELQLAKLTLIDVLKFYAAMHALPETTPGKAETVMATGGVLRDAIASVAAIARKASQIENELKGKHDPQITMQFIMQTVKVVDQRLREAERLGHCADAESIMQLITQDVGSQVGMVDGQINNNAKGSNISPSTANEMVQSMIDTVPAVAG